MKKTILLIIILLSLAVKTVLADVVINNGILFLRDKQDASGQITGGSTGDASPWAAIAFSANGIDIATVKNPTNSLNDYLLNYQPTAPTSSAMEWEKWILAITASGQDPYNFGTINYVATLESSTYYNNNQIGDTFSVNDDWFGVLALISSGVANSDPVLTNSLAFVLNHQNTDGGYGYSITAGSDSNDTAAAIQALVAAKKYEINTNGVDIDEKINKAKTYLLSTQAQTGGFLYDRWTTGPDSDSTTWALMALNVLGMQNSSQINNARTWLLSQQSTTDGGFTACNQWDPKTYACTGYASNSTTTSHALIALAGKGWLLKIFTPSGSPTPTPTVTPSPLATPSPSPSPTPSPTPTPNPSPTPTPTPSPSPTPSPMASPSPKIVYVYVYPSPTPEVLGEEVSSSEPAVIKEEGSSRKIFLIIPGLIIIFLALKLWRTSRA